MIEWESTARGARRWPKAADDMLRDLWARGDTGTEIADAMGITKNSVVGRAHRLGLPARPSPIGLGSRPRNSAPRQGGDLARRAAAGVAFPAQHDDVSSHSNFPALAARLTNPLPAPGFLVRGSQPRPQVFPVRGCQFPLWPHGSRVALEDLRFCDAAPRRNKEGRQDSAYCEAHHAWCFAKMKEAA